MNQSKFIKIFSKTKIRRAFTLLEIIIAIFVLEVGLLGVAKFYAYSFKISRIARNQTIASNLAGGVMEELVAENFDSDILSVGQADPVAYSATEPFNNFQKQININYLNPADLTNSDTPTDMKKIMVTILWQEGGNDAKFEIATIKTSQ